jgi:hypothetical protein
MHAQSDSQHDAHAEAPRTTEGLFSHPDSDRADTMPGPSPVADQRSYTGLFREPADGPENTTSAA